MPCNTVTTVEIDDDELTKEAAKNLGIDTAQGRVSKSDARAIKLEASVLKSIKMVKRMDPRAIVIRKGNELEVTVTDNIR